MYCPGLLWALLPDLVSKWEPSTGNLVILVKDKRHQTVTEVMLFTSLQKEETREPGFHRAGESSESHGGHVEE